MRVIPATKETQCQCLKANRLTVGDMGLGGNLEAFSI